MKEKIERAKGITSPGELLVLGETNFRREHRRFGLLPDDRLRHVWVIGKTGSGKSTLLANMIADDLTRGRGVGLLDPHGDLVDAVLPHVPRARINDVLLFSPGDIEYPVSFNVFRYGREAPSSRALLASELVSVFRKQWSSSWGPRLEHVLRAGILAIASRDDATLLLLYRFLTEKSLRERITATIPDLVIRQFWQTEFPSYDRALQGEALSPVLNKLGAFIAQPVIRNIVSQERSRVALAELMDRRGVLLANLATGVIGEDASSLLGGLLISACFLSAARRKRGGPPFILYADEFQRFASDSIITVLSEARKFGLGLVLAHQYLEQVPDAITKAIIGNIGTKLVFRLGAEDAITLAPDFAPWFAPSDLQNLDRYEMVVKLLARGKELIPFTAHSLPPRPLPPAASETIASIVKASRARFAQPREEIEQAIHLELGH